ncbi:hypothetical protein Taro_041671 [Colocasia esculenta]|uniref:Myb/SANT-like DNA-binding domain-containing protein n=1 Tax=Colocasia esculenta TaxID=4460 RepID=A0A843WEY9_COLES|nr:hypothetical protein [Colocasia esculenta]
MATGVGQVATGPAKGHDRAVCSGGQNATGVLSRSERDKKGVATGLRRRHVGPSHSQVRGLGLTEFYSVLDCGPETCLFDIGTPPPSLRYFRNPSTGANPSWLPTAATESAGVTLSSARCTPTASHPHTLAARGGSLRYSPPHSLILLTPLPLRSGAVIPPVALASSSHHAGDMDHPSRAGGSSGGGREDCWSEGATGALVEAWGDRYIELSRGNLRQKDWKDVADMVNEHLEATGKPHKTDIQCKNRIDTVKKKYKIEKARPGPSQWTFFSRLDSLVGPGSSNGGAKKAHQNTGALAVKPQSRPLSITVKHRAPANPNPKPSLSLCSEGSSSRSKINSSPISCESSRGDSGGGGARSDDDLGVGDDVDEGGGLFRGGKVNFERRRPWGSSLDVNCVVGGGGGSGGDGVDGAFVELAKAIVNFGEIYERVESSKQQQMLELERQRMEFAKELEFQRMQMFMEAQLELEKMKRPKYAFGAVDTTFIPATDDNITNFVARYHCLCGCHLLLLFLWSAPCLHLKGLLGREEGGLD